MCKLSKEEQLVGQVWCVLFTAPAQLQNSITLPIQKQRLKRANENHVYELLYDSSGVLGLAS